MEHTVKVRTIPLGIQFPAHMQNKIRMDLAGGQLVFRGFMSKSEYDQLMRLSTDVTYQDAISQLFQLSTPSDASQLRHFGRVLVALTVTCLLLTATVWWSLLSRPLPTNNSRMSSIMSVNGSLETRDAQDLNSER